jgi:hypothetical protein
MREGLSCAAQRWREEAARVLMEEEEKMVAAVVVVVLPVSLHLLAMAAVF